MLILTRRPGESLVIGDDPKVEIIVLSTRGNQVRIGINAPKDVSVYREEIYNRIKEMEGKSNGIKEAQGVTTSVDE